MYKSEWLIVSKKDKWWSFFTFQKRKKKQLFVNKNILFVWGKMFPISFSNTTLERMDGDLNPTALKLQN